MQTTGKIYNHQKILDTFEFLTRYAKQSKQTTWGAFWNGKRIKSTTGKMSWNTIGGAKNAVRLALGNHEATQSGFKNAAEACKFYEDKGLLTYKELK